MSKINQRATICNGCRRADKYGKPEWHKDCANGRRYTKSTINIATGETTWGEWNVGACNCNCAKVKA